MKMNLEVITVSNGSKDYFDDFTPEEIKIIKENVWGNILHLFSGSSKIGDVRIDFSHKNANRWEDVFTYLEEFSFLQTFHTVIIDAPYNQKYADKYQKAGKTPKQFIIFANTRDTTRLFNLIEENIKPLYIILKSWNFYIPRGYNLKKGYLCYAGGYRKPTILEILRRETSKLEFSKKIKDTLNKGGYS